MSHRETDSRVCLRTPKRVLIYDRPEVDDNLETVVREMGYAPETVTDLAAAIEQFEQRDFPLVLIRTDEAGSGLDFVCSAHSPKNTAVIAITSCAACESAILSLRAGARDYVVWPGLQEEMGYILKRVFEEVEHARFREDMLCMLTHDIKIPLSSILGYSTLIFEKESGSISPRAEDFVKIINSSGLKILSLIDNFLTTNKIDSGKLHLCLDDVNVGLFIHDLATTFQVEIDRHRLRLRLEIENDLPLLEADEGLLFRAVGNLLSNACKFSPEGTDVTISARAAMVAADKGCDVAGIAISVSNEGAGLSASEIPEIFERYRRGQAQGSIEGSGLGAYVVKSIAEAHRGTVCVESIPNRLTTFSICLPLNVV